MSTSNLDQSDLIQQIRKDIFELRLKLKAQEDLLQGVVEWQDNHLYKEAQLLETKRHQKQAQYKQLMKDRYPFVRSSTGVQATGQSFLDEKLIKVIHTLTRQIENIIESKVCKSSISSYNFDKVESIDWLQEERAQKHFKQHQKIEADIKDLEKILEEIG